MVHLKHWQHLVAFPSVHWDFNWERQHSIITHLAEETKGRVIVHPPYGLINHNIRTIIEKLRQRNQLTTAAPNNPRLPKMEFVQPLFIPLHYTAFLDGINAHLIKRATPVSCSTSLGYFTYVNGALLRVMDDFTCTVLDIAQRRQAIPELSDAAKITEKKAVQKATIVIVDSITTRNDYKTIRDDIHYLPQGVDLKRFKGGTIEPKIADWKAPFDCVIGYSGSDLAVDVPLLEELIQQQPKSGFLLIGQFDRPEMQRLQAYPNVLMPGRIPFEKLPDFYAAMDIGLIPYLLTDRILGVFPTKFFEYLAFGMPVISTQLPDLIPFAQREIALVSSAQEAGKRIAEWTEGGWDKQALKALAKMHTWEARFEQIDSLIANYYQNKPY